MHAVAVSENGWKRAGKLIVDLILAGGEDVPSVSLPPRGDISILSNYLNQLREPGDPLDVDFPNRIQTYRIEQSSWAEFVLRLPPWQVAKEGHSRVCGPGNIPLPGVNYDPPPFYELMVNRDPPSIDNCQFFLCRVADYTMSMCK